MAQSGKSGLMRCKVVHAGDCVGRKGVGFAGHLLGSFALRSEWRVWLDGWMGGNKQ